MCVAVPVGLSIIALVRLPLQVTIKKGSIKTDDEVLSGDPRGQTVKKGYGSGELWANALWSCWSVASALRFG